jgi:hypothetical protein
MSDPKPIVATEYNLFEDILGGAGKFLGALCDGVNARLAKLESDRATLLAAIDTALANPGSEWPRILREAAERVRGKKGVPHAD